jgi:hypothetical protein
MTKYGALPRPWEIMQMAETTKFWLLVALVCGAFAVAEYMYAREAIRICRDRTEERLYKIAVALVLFVDCFGFLACMAGHEGKEAMDCYIRWCRMKACCDCVSSTAGEIGTWLLMSPVMGQCVSWMFLPLFILEFFVPPGIPDCARVYLMLPTVLLGIPLVAISFTAPFIRAMVMYKAPKCSLWKIIFVFYVTYWPLAFLFPHIAKF